MIAQIKSGEVEAGLNELLEKVTKFFVSLVPTSVVVEFQVKEVYGGEGKVKVKKKNKNRVFSFKYTGPERAAKLLEGEDDRFLRNEILLELNLYM